MQACEGLRLRTPLPALAHTHPWGRSRAHRIPPAVVRGRWGTGAGERAAFDTGMPIGVGPALCESHPPRPARAGVGWGGQERGDRAVG